MSAELDQKTRAALVKRINAKFAESDKFMDALRNDFRFSQTVLKQDRRNQILRRMTVRNFCALVEAAVHEMKWLSLIFHGYLNAELSEADVACLREEG